MTTGTPSLFDVRRSGVLLHPTSLPGPHGCGDFGAARGVMSSLMSGAADTR